MHTLNYVTKKKDAVSLSKKRPKTANRDTSVPKPVKTQSRSRLATGSTPSKVMIGDPNFNKTVSQLMQPQLFSTIPKSITVAATPTTA